jgi:two-component system sensor histidine kinase BaeS
VKFRLRTRLIMGFVIITVLTMGAFALVARISITQRFNNMVHQAGQEYAQRMSVFFGLYYASNGSWDGVQDLFINYRSPVSISISNNPPQIPPYLNTDPGGIVVGRFPNRGIIDPRDERLLLLDANGALIFDSNPDAGSPDSLLARRDEGVNIVIDNQTVGTVVAASGIGILNSVQESYINDVNQYTLIGGLAAILIAVVLGAYQAFKIIKPVKALSQASHKLASGDYSQRIPSTSDDELGEMSNAFNQMAEELERQETLRQRALADVAHELRTPLSVLQIDLESIEDGILEPSKETIHQLQLEVSTLNKLVDDLRTLSLADAGELVMDFQQLEINSLIRVNVKRIANSAKEKGIQVSVDLEEDELFVMGDEQRLSQVLLNLLTNAIHFTPQNGSIHVSSKREGNAIRVLIHDTGEGISAQDLPLIFERLYRSDHARTRESGGSGLGLSIARSLVEAHHGKIWADSEPGKGSTFIFELPEIKKEK